MKARAATLAAVAVAVAAMLAPAAVHGERSQAGNLIVALNGGIAPLDLPRDRTAPVAVSLQGKIATADGSSLPRLTRIDLGLAGKDLLFTRGLAVCPRARLRNATSRQALDRCGAALVGNGRLDADVFVPNQSPFAIHAHLLAFNGRARGGRTAIWVHAFSLDPPVSLVFSFVVQPGGGAFPTRLLATVPRSVGPLPHLAAFELTLRRRFSFAGKRHSYISASCPVPKPFTAGFLTFARATYHFADGRQLGIESVRSCRARG
jgi:hypothetical protein